VVLDGPEQTRGHPARAKNALEEIRCRRLAIGSCDPSQAQPALRVAEERPGRLGESPPDDWNLNPPRGQFRRRRAFTHNRYRALRQRLRDEAMSVGLLTLDGKKEGARLYPARIVG